MSRIDVIHLACNIVSSISIVLVNRKLLSNGEFDFPLTLTGTHLIASGFFGYVWCRKKGNMGEFKFDKTIFQLVALAILSLGFLNLSLMKNTVSMYQSAKLLIVPCSAIFEYISMKSRLTFKQVVFVMVSLVGVGLVSISDITFGFSLSNAFYAFFSIIFSSLQQIYTRQVQVLGLHSPEKLLMVIGTTSGLLLLAVGPLFDASVKGSNCWIMIRKLNGSSLSIFCVFLSISLAILVNFSQYTCLGKFSVVTFQVLGHIKTIMIFLLSWLIFEENISQLKIAGCCLTIYGIYGFSNSAHPPEKVPTSPLPEPKQ